MTKSADFDEDGRRMPMTPVMRLIAGTGVGGTLLILLTVVVPFGISNWDKVWNRADKLAAARDAERVKDVREGVERYVQGRKIDYLIGLSRANNEAIKALCQSLRDSKSTGLDCTKLGAPPAAF
ncbi:MAG: hypothetical protein AAF903_11930 [Pseudomonadota bacterium]